MQVVPTPAPTKSFVGLLTVSGMSVTLAVTDPAAVASAAGKESFAKAVEAIASAVVEVMWVDVTTVDGARVVFDTVVVLPTPVAASEDGAQSATVQVTEALKEAVESGAFAAALADTPAYASLSPAASAFVLPRVATTEHAQLRPCVGEFPPSRPTHPLSLTLPPSASRQSRSRTTATSDGVRSTFRTEGAVRGGK